MAEAESGQLPPPPPPPADASLLRLLSSDVLDIHLAIHWLYYAKSDEIRRLIVSRLDEFDTEQTDFYLPQLVNMYANCGAEMSSALRPYLESRCSRSAEFSCRLAWLLDAHGARQRQKRRCHALHLRDCIVSEQLGPEPPARIAEADVDRPHSRQEQPGHQQHQTHKRCASDALQFDGWSDRIRRCRTTAGNLNSGRAFASGCQCPAAANLSVSCSCGSARLLPQLEFVKSLMRLSRRLRQYPSREARTSHLHGELALLNFNLPARVWLPVGRADHCIVRIPHTASAVLNSKDKAPYLVYVETVSLDDPMAAEIPVGRTLLLPNSSVAWRSQEELVQQQQQQLQQQQQQQQLQHQQTASSTVGNADACCSSSGCCSEEPIAIDSVDGGSSCLSGGEEDAGPAADRTLTSASSAPPAVVRSPDVISLADAADVAIGNGHAGLVAVDADAGDSNLFSPADVRRRLSAGMTNWAAAAANAAANQSSPESASLRSFQLCDRDDPSLSVLREPFSEKRRRVRESSPFGHLASWELRAAIVKCDDDLRQELLAHQVLRLLSWIWEAERVPLWLCPLSVTVAGDRAGLIEPVADANSLHQIRRMLRAQRQPQQQPNQEKQQQSKQQQKQQSPTLLTHFEQEFGPPNSEAFLEAQRNFVESTAAYCIVCYLLQVKDRHNGNILLDNRGHVIHIDFGFMLSSSPGRNLGFESSHFKLTSEYVEVMGGHDADMYKYFRVLLLRGMLAARKHFDKILTLVDITSEGSDLPCFAKGPAATLAALRERFHLGCTELQLQRLLESMVEASLHSISTRLYDSFQYLANGIE